MRKFATVAATTEIPYASEFKSKMCNNAMQKGNKLGDGVSWK